MWGTLIRWVLLGAATGGLLGWLGRQTSNDDAQRVVGRRRRSGRDHAREPDRRSRRSRGQGGVADAVVGDSSGSQSGNDRSREPHRAVSNDPSEVTDGQTPTKGKTKEAAPPNPNGQVPKSEAAEDPPEASPEAVGESDERDA